MKKPLAACLVALSLSGCTVISNLSSGEDDGAQVTGSGKLKADNRKLSAFHAVEVKGALDCDIKIGKASDVTVEADDNLLPLVKTDVKDGVLIIKTDGNFSTHQSIKVAFTMPELTDGTLSGSGNFNVTGFEGKSLKLSLVGSGNITCDGKCDKIDADLSGSGELNLASLISSNASVDLSGSGNVKVNATDDLSATLSGSGEINYAGHPKSLHKQVSGSGEITGS